MEDIRTKRSIGMSSGIIKEERYIQLTNKILDAKSNVSKNLFEIGLDLSEIRQMQLYKEEFDTFDSFLENKVEIARSTAFECIRISQEYSIKEWNQLGHSKCQILLKLEKSKRLDFLKQFDGTSREMKKSVSQYQIECGLKTTEKAISQLKIDKPPISRGDQEKALKCRREGHILIAELEKFISVKKGLVGQVELWLKESGKYGESIEDVRNRVLNLNDNI